MKRNLLCFIIAFSIILTALTPQIVLAVDVAKENVISIEELNFLTALDIYTEKQSTTITRAEFAVYLAKLVNIDNYSSKLKFSDVAIDYWACDAITLMSDMGIINGNSNGTFNPEGTLSYNEAVKMLVCLVGYNVFIFDETPYPNAYLAQANKYGITKNIPYISTPLTNNEALKLIYNTLFADVVEQNGVGESLKYSIKKGYNVLAKFHKTFEVEGIVTSNDFTSLDGVPTAKAGAITLENNNKSSNYDYLNSDVNDKLGCKVKLFYRENDLNKEVVFYEENKNNDVFTIEGVDIEKFDLETRKLTYFDGKKYRDIKLPMSLKFIYNDIAHPNYLADDFKPTDGNVKLIDNNADGTYDVLFVYNTDSYIVDSVDSNNSIIFTKFNDGRIDASNIGDETKTVITLENGANVPIEELSSWIVLSVNQSFDKKVKRIYASAENISGKIDSIQTDEEKHLISINNVAYEVIPNCKNRELAKSGEYINAYLDYKGRIVAFNTSSDAMRNGYLVKHNLTNDFDQKLIMKIFDETGEMKTLYCEDKIIIDGKFIKENSKEAFRKFTKASSTDTLRQMIRYKTNSINKITEIDTIKLLDGESPTSLNLNYNTFVPDSTDPEIDATGKKLKYRSAVLTFAGEVFINRNTKVFLVPREENKDDDDYYSVKNYSYFLYDQPYEFKAYNTDKSKILTQSMLIYQDAKGSGSVSELNELAIIGEITEAIKKDGLTGKKVEMIYENKKVSFFTTESASHVDLKPGDIIRFRLNALGELDLIEKNYSFETNRIYVEKGTYDEYGNKEYEPINDPYNYKDIYNQVRISTGYVHSRDDNFVRVLPMLAYNETDLQNATMQNGLEIHMSDLYKIYIYHTKRSNNKITVGTNKDLYDFVSGNDLSSKVVIQAYRGEPKVMVIFK